MKLLGAEVRPVTSGSRTLRDAINEALRDWMSSVAHTHYIIGSVVGPHPFPRIVRDFQSVIGRETREQCLDQLGRLPDIVVACVGGGSNAAGMFYPLLGDTAVRLVGVEAGGRSAEPGEPAPCIRYRPDSTIPASGPSTASGRKAAAFFIRNVATWMRWPHSTSWPEPKEFCPPWKALMQSPTRCVWRRRAPRARQS
jgi:hypothetical protein